jgi:hypothetical protein
MDIQVEYVIIDKKAIENRLEKLKVFQYHNQEAIYELEQILSQSTPLIPEIEKSFDSGVNSVILKIICIACTLMAAGVFTSSKNL